MLGGRRQGDASRGAAAWPKDPEPEGEGRRFRDSFEEGWLLGWRVMKNFRPVSAFLIFLLLPLMFAAVPAASEARGPKVYAEGGEPEDTRFGELRTLDSFHPFRGGAGSPDEWAARSEEIVRRVKVAAGLWPEPAKAPLHAVVHGLREMGDYTIEKVYFQSLPGHYVTGSLYRPSGASAAHGLASGKRPGVLCPHGHWNGGRFLDQSNESRAERQVKNALAMGAERFVSAARSPLQARCVQLARMGCVVFHYDMLANADSVQFPSHKIAPREEMNSLQPGEWGFAGAAAVARLQSSFGLQTWNSVRALDFLLSRKEVDPERVLVTGASGGGTQTMMVTAVDERVRAAFPCVMPSTAMQGGCTCENANLLRIGQGNIDIAAATAPRPLGMTAADDWTIELESKGHPDLVNLYKVLGLSNAYEAHFNIHFKHNYNHVSRTQMYNFVNRHFALGFAEPVLERDFTFLDGGALTVWDEVHPHPSGPETGAVHEKAVCRWMTRDSGARMRRLLSPADGKTLGEARRVIGGGLGVLVGRRVPAADAVGHELVEKWDRGAYVEMTGVVRNFAEGEEIPAVHLYPAQWNHRVVLWVHPAGKSGLYDKDGTPRLEVLQLLEAGYAVAGADLIGQGEHVPVGEARWGTRNRDVSAGREIRPGREWQQSALYTYGYNHALFAQRVHDVMTMAVSLTTNPKWEVEDLALIGAEGAGHWVVAARAVSGDLIDRVAADLGGFRFAKLGSVWDADFLPGAVKYGDVAGLLVSGAPGKLWVRGVDQRAAAALRATYGAAGAGDRVLIEKGKAGGAMEKAAEWIVASP